MIVNYKIENYKDIKNYIHNYLGLTKEEVNNIIRDTIKLTVQEEVNKQLNDKEQLIHLIEKEVLRQLKYGREVEHERRSFLISTMDAIYNKIDKTIHEEVCKRLVITLKEE